MIIRHWCPERSTCSSGISAKDRRFCRLLSRYAFKCTKSFDATPETVRTNTSIFSCKLHPFVFVYSQVQLLVTSQDVENYKQIKSDLDQLRSIVEKSELWVYKRQGSEEGMDTGEGLCAEPEHKLVPYFENSLSSKCYSHKSFVTIVSVFLQGDMVVADKTKKPESTSSYNYRVVKEVRVQTGDYQKAFPPHTPDSPLYPFSSSIRSCSGSASCVSRKVCQAGRARNSSRGC